MELIGELIGENGRYQHFVFIFVILTGFIAPWHHFMTQFIAPPVKHWCSKPQSWINATDELFLNVSGQSEALQNHSKSCLINDIDYDNISIHDYFNAANSESQIKCSNFEFSQEYGPTISQKWDLVCDDDVLVSASTSIYFAGMMVGVLIMGQLSDRIGRKKVLLACLVLWFCTSIALIASEYFILFVALRFFVGLFNEGGFVVEWVLFMEICSSRQRAILGNLSSLGFALGFAGFACLAYLLKDWQLIVLVSSLPVVPLFIYACFLLESPIWLISQGNLIDAKTAITKAAKFNKVQLQPETTINELLLRHKHEIEEKPSSDSSATLKNLFVTPNMRKKTLIIYFIWLVDAFVYYGLTVNTVNLDGDFYVNFALSGIVEFPAYLLCIVVLLKFGRRIPLCILFLIGGVSLLLTLVVPKGLSWPVVALSMIGKFGIAATFQMTYVYTSELFPTVVRNIGLGSSSMFSRFGSIVSPFISNLTKTHGKLVPPVVFGILSVIAGFLVLLLPETKDCILPQSIDDGESFVRGSEKNVNASAKEDATKDSHL